MIQSTLMISTLLVASVSAHYIPEDCTKGDSKFVMDSYSKFASVYQSLVAGLLPNGADFDAAYQQLDVMLPSELTRMHICYPDSSLVQNLLTIAYESKKYGYAEGANPKRILQFYTYITRRVHNGDGSSWYYSMPTNNLFDALLGLKSSKEATPMLVQRAFLDYVEALESWAALDYNEEYSLATSEAQTLLGYVTALPTNQLARSVFPSCNQKTLIDSGKIPELSKELEKSVERRADMYKVDGDLTYEPNEMVG